MNLTETAQALGYSKGRISQLAKQGKLNGAFAGEGRQRQFNLEKAAELLSVRLDTSQQTGNGLDQMMRRAALTSPTSDVEDSDARRLARARADAAEVAARQKAREEAEATGRYVLADDHRRACRALVAQTVACAERVLVDEARRLARALGADPAQAVADVRARWRKVRAEQAQAFGALAEAAGPTESETAEMATA